MRKITDIKESIAGDFMRNEDVAKAYGFKAGESFTAHFSKASVESVLFYIFATAAWVLENLFDEHKKEVTTRIEEILPHRPKWYRDKALAFMANKALMDDTDVYDITGMDGADIAAARIVKHAVAVESKDASILTIKIAGEVGGRRCKLSTEAQRQVMAYMAEIKDAGVRINMVNINADTLACTVDVYYNAMLRPSDVESACRAAIKGYVENLPFNGEYTNMALMDSIQQVEGVEVVEFKGAAARADDQTTDTIIDARYTPAAGYLTPGALQINMVAYE